MGIYANGRAPLAAQSRGRLAHSFKVTCQGRAAKYCEYADIWEVRMRAHLSHWGMSGRALRKVSWSKFMGNESHVNERPGYDECSNDELVVGNKLTEFPLKTVPVSISEHDASIN